jgi:predicted acylesterase/phospholipase RssA
VVTADGEHVLVDHGPLPAAVAASAAIPFVFSSVDVPGGCAGSRSSIDTACISLLGPVDALHCAVLC